MTNYAEGTTVPVERSKAEIDKILSRHGAQQRATMHDETKGEAIVAFVVAGARYRILVPLPTLASLEAAREKGQRIPTSRHVEQAARERWRAVVLLLKAKFEMVSIGMSTIEREFMADLILPNGQVVHQALGEMIRRGLSFSPTEHGRRRLYATASEGAGAR